jgi:uncharacterized protein (DUF58 family)
MLTTSSGRSCNPLRRRASDGRPTTADHPVGALVTPSRRLLGVLAVWLVLGIAASAWRPLAMPWAGAGIAVLTFVLLDLVLVVRLPWPTVRRVLPKALALGEWHDVALVFESAAATACHLTVFDHAPDSIDVEGMPRAATLPARGRVEIPFRIRPRLRGNQSFAGSHVRVSSPLGLLSRQRLLGQPEPVRVYPNFRQVARYALLALDHRTGAFGVHLQRQRGEGLEFHQLREYRDGDSLRQVDWKAVSRRGRLISREYREEKDQQVILMLDCGRRMHTRDGDLSFFDRVLDAALLLSYVALRQGDAVGIMTFSGQDRWIPPRKGRSAMTPLINTVYDLQTTTAPSDFAEAAHRLATRQKRRCLVVLLTNLRDDDAVDLPLALAPLRRRHLVLLASLREPALAEALEADVEGFEDALRFVATQSYMEGREKAHALVRRAGLRALDVEPAELPAALVNRYLDIKRAGAL